MTPFKTSAMLAAVVFAMSLAPMAARQEPPKSHSKAEIAEVSKTFTIESIDYKTRIVTLKDKDGKIESLVAGPQIQRFNELKAGDQVTFHYIESLVTAIRPAGTLTTGTSAQSSVIRDKGTKPAGTYAEQLTATVTITALDPKVPSVSVRTVDGKDMSFKVKDAKNLEHVKVGDHVEITYSRALAVRVDPPK